jgi:hypothetical protein
LILLPCQVEYQKTSRNQFLIYIAFFTWKIEVLLPYKARIRFASLNLFSKWCFGKPATRCDVGLWECPLEGTSSSISRNQSHWTMRGQNSGCCLQRLSRGTWAQPRNAGYISQRPAGPQFSCLRLRTCRLHKMSFSEVSGRPRDNFS